MAERDGISPDLKAHATDEQLELYALGRLSDSDGAVIEQHLMMCEPCRCRLDGIGDFAAGIRAAGIESMAQNDKATPSFLESVRPLLRRPAVSMSLAFVVLLIVIGIFSTGKNELPPVATLQLSGARGAMPVTPAARAYDLRLTDGPRDGGPFRVEVLTAAGGSMWANLAQGGPSGVEVHVTQRLPAGDYLVRVSAADGKLLREYGFRVR